MAKAGVAMKTLAARGGAPDNGRRTKRQHACQLVVVEGELGRSMTMGIRRPFLEIALPLAWLLGFAGWAAAAGSDDELLARFRAAFEPGPRSFGSGVSQDVTVGRCGTPLVMEYLARRDSLAPATTEAIDQYLAVTDVGDTLLSAEGHFRLIYTLDGDNAVPLADTDPADGIPDFVASAASYLETAWTTEVGDLQLRPAPPGQPVEVSFRRMNFYGYTVPVDPEAGTTRLVFNSRFSRFPPNDDPDGDVAGSAKITAAHEFRHASQYAGSRWSEGGWVELDAVWAEERVFEQVNAYRYYLLGDSPVRRPRIPLDGGQTGTGSYDDAVFEIWLNRRWGDTVIREYWERRAAVPAESPLASWDVVLEPRGVFLATAWADFIGWNFATGTRAVPGVGYPEAADYPTGDLEASLSSYPSTVSGSVEHLAAAPVLLGGFAELGDRLVRIRFEGDGDPDPLALALHVQTVDGGAYLETVGLDRRNNANIVLQTPADGLRAVGVIVGNGAATGPTRFWTLAVDTVAGRPAGPAGELKAAEPNPCNPATWLTCEMSARASTTLDIVDAAGRRVRQLWSGSLGPGTHRFFWDGRTDGGRPAPAGLYVARLGTPHGWHGRKLTLVR